MAEKRTVARRSLAAALLLAAPLPGCRGSQAREDELAIPPADSAAVDAGPDAPPDAAPDANVRDPWRLSFVDVQGRGVMIDRLDVRSFAAPLLQAGDIIIGVDDRSVASSAELDRYLRSLHPGAVVVITLRRGDQLQYVMLQVPP